MKPMSATGAVPPGLVEHLEQVLPGWKVAAAVPLKPDEGLADATTKREGYGVPLRLTLEADDGARRVVVLHFAKPDIFGHDRRSDRAQQMLLAFDTFGALAHHVRALDVGAVAAGGRLLSLRDTGEFYLLTDWAPGHVYAEDLRRIAHTGEVTALDLVRCDALVRTLAALHAERIYRPAAYTRAIRDLVGHGEGIFGIVDGYPPDVPAASPARLEAIERRCVAWRWKLRGCEGRLRRTHGDFHPFNVVFDATTPTLLDASRGALGDPADDVMCMAINYLFFALERPRSWPHGLGVLWHRFLDRYLDARNDVDLDEVAAPFLAWRGLVLANPRWYPALPAAARDRLLGFVERVLDAPRLDAKMADELFT